MKKGPITYKFEELVAFKAAGLADAKRLEKLRADADDILKQPILRVTDKRLKAPSGDIHDYMSMGLYWWPNPDTPDGLPYIRRDGYANPDANDGISPGKIYGRIKQLALAAFYFEDKAKEYADYAERQLYDWFVNPETKIAPNARFAQAIPGICEGRCTGIIDFSASFLVIDGVGILEELGLISDEVASGVRAWFYEFTDWLLTHKNGIEECNDTDNHGSWYDAQIIVQAIFTDRPQLARNIALTAYDRRVKTLVKPDGSQPSELRRTQAINYSLYNLDAMMVIAACADSIGFSEYWGIDEKRGECILKSAVDYLYPFVLGEREFPYVEFHPERCAEKLAATMRSVAKRYPGYDERIAKLTDMGSIEPAK